VIGIKVGGSIDRLTSEHPMRSSLEVEFCSIRVRILANRPEVIERLRSYFSSFTAGHAFAFAGADIEVSIIDCDPVDLGLDLVPNPPSPGKRHVKEEYIDLEDGRVVRKRKTGMVFFLSPGRSVAVGPALKNLNQIINLINNLYISIRLSQGYLLTHAAGLVLRGHGIAIAGASGAGKSSLALRFMNSGAAFVSNDRLLIREIDTPRRMLGVAKYPRINPGTVVGNPRLHGLLSAEVLEKIGRMPKGDLWHLESKIDVPIEHIYGDHTFRLSAKLDLFLVLTWQFTSREPTKVCEVTRARLPALLPFITKEHNLFAVHPGIPSSEFSTIRQEEYFALLSRMTILEASGCVDFDVLVGETERFLQASDKGSESRGHSRPLPIR